MDHVRRSVTFNGREVKNPLLRKLIVLLLIVLMPLLFLFLFAMLPIMLAVHPLFAFFGLKGTIRQEVRGKVSLTLDHNSFKRKGTPDTEQGIISKLVGAVVFFGFVYLLVWWLFL